MYRKKQDLSKKREGKVLAIYAIHRTLLHKRSQRKNIWKRIWSGIETQNLNIYIGITGNFVGNDQVRFIGTDIDVFGYQVRSLRRYLGDDQKREFDRFYREK